ncbi:MAG: hypothetical protein ACM3NO_00315, partial [Deltaproteobacteria bacterium]
MFPGLGYAQAQQEQTKQDQSQQDQTQADQQQPTEEATAAAPEEQPAPTVGPTAFVEIQGARS